MCHFFSEKQIPKNVIFLQIKTSIHYDILDSVLQHMNQRANVYRVVNQTRRYSFSHDLSSSWVLFSASRVVFISPSKWHFYPQASFISVNRCEKIRLLFTLDTHEWCVIIRLNTFQTSINILHSCIYHTLQNLLNLLLFCQLSILITVNY